MDGCLQLSNFLLTSIIEELTNKQFNFRQNNLILKKILFFRWKILDASDRPRHLFFRSLLHAFERRSPDR